MGQVGTFRGQLVKHGVSDQLDGQLDVAQWRAEPDRNQRENWLERSDMETLNEKLSLKLVSIKLNFHLNQPETSGRNETFFHNLVS